MNWVKKHKVVFIMSVLILLITFSGIFYVQSKLNLIQRDTASGLSTDSSSAEEIPDENDEEILHKFIYENE